HLDGGLTKRADGHPALSNIGCGNGRSEDEVSLGITHGSRKILRSAIDAEKHERGEKPLKRAAHEKTFIRAISQ
ncbi:hypothetical protein QSI15_26705, partial [Escherichia coli]|uniref:hypothetical protein n=1 Tax=Escherichia coli TaxID=562 RepID=UPI00256EA8E0